MWFKFPKGCDSISVDRQVFKTEYENESGKFFRAPDHFAPKILSIGMGFEIVAQPEGAMEDLPKQDPARDNTIGQMAIEAEGLKAELQGVREDLQASNAKIIALVADKEKLSVQLQDALHKINMLEEQIEELGHAPKEDDIMATIEKKNQENGGLS